MNLPKNLPIWQVEQAIINALRDHRVVVVSAETGSGKTTQIPQMLRSAGYTVGDGRVVVTQPRRVAASAAAKRVAEEMGVVCGQEVGYQFRHDRQLGPETEIAFVTEGILLQEAKSNPSFRGYSVIMLDEVHERSIDMDTLLGVVKLALGARGDLRVVVSSATLDAERLVEFFDNGATLVECEGRTHPVTMQFAPTHQYMTSPRSMGEAAVEIINSTHGDVLFFLPGYDWMSGVKKVLDDTLKDAVEILMAHGDMPMEEMDKLFQEHRRRRVILATNVAETSLTIDGVKVVIDSGLVKKDFFSADTGIQTLKEVSNSKSSVRQRAGRAGRTASGECHCLFSKRQFDDRPEFDIPAILRSDLSTVVLTLAKIGITGLDRLMSFPFMDGPGADNLKAALNGLVAMGALDESGKLTDYGDMLSRFPLPPSEAHLLAQAGRFNAVGEMATLIAMVEAKPVPQPRTLSDGTRESPPEIVREFTSDMEMWLGLWGHYYESGFSWAWAKEAGLNPKRMDEARKNRAQLLDLATEHGLTVVSSDNIANLKLALIAARPNNIGKNIDRGAYICAGSDETSYGHRVFIFPGSCAFIGSGRFLRLEPLLMWHMGVRETTKPYAHCCMEVTAEEIKEACPDLCSESIALSRSFPGQSTMAVYSVTEFCKLTISTTTIAKEEPTDGFMDLFETKDRWGYTTYQATITFDEWERRRGEASLYSELRILTQVYVHSDDSDISEVAADLQGLWNSSEPLRDRVEKARELRGSYDVLMRACAQREQEVKHQREERRQQRRDALHATIPTLPPEPQTWMLETKRRIEQLLAHWCTDDDIDEAERQIGHLAFEIDQWHKRVALVASGAEWRDFWIEAEMDFCPICNAALVCGECGCVGQFMTDAQLTSYGLRNGHTRGKPIRKLVARDAYTSVEIVLAEVFIRRLRGAPARVAREIPELTRPIDTDSIKLIALEGE